MKKGFKGRKCDMLRYAEANNKYIKDCGKDKELRYLLCMEM